MQAARYADGRAAVTQDVHVDLGIGAEALRFAVGETQHSWIYAELRRADDGAGRVILKRKPDTGERLYFDAEAAADLRIAAPELFTSHAMGVEGRATIGALIGAAWTLAAVFLLGVPLAAEPIADVIPMRYREQIGDISWSQVNGFASYCDDSDEASRVLNDMAHRIMTTSNVAQRDDIWITIVDAPFPNAFAMPDNSIIVTDDLIEMAEHPDELTGVLAHEIAHIERNHVMKNIVRSVGAGIFFDIVFGGSGAGQMIAIASVNLAGLRYSRGDEADADERGLDYLTAAGIDPGGLARLFARFEARDEEEHAAIPELLSSHPATAARAAAARARSGRGQTHPSLTDGEWQIVRRACGGGIAEGAPVTPAPAQAPDQPATPSETAEAPKPVAGDAAKPD